MSDFCSPGADVVLVESVGVDEAAAAAEKHKHRHGHGERESLSTGVDFKSWPTLSRTPAWRGF